MEEDEQETDCDELPPAKESHAGELDVVAVLWEGVTAYRGAVDSSLRVKEDEVIKGTGTDRFWSSDVVERGRRRRRSSGARTPNHTNSCGSIMSRYIDALAVLMIAP